MVLSVALNFLIFPDLIETLLYDHCFLLILFYYERLAQGAEVFLLISTSIY